VVISPDKTNIGVIGSSGEGKSHFFEHRLWPAMSKATLLIDPKNQYRYLKKEGFRFHTITGADPIREYRGIMTRLRTIWRSERHRYVIRWIPEDITEGQFNYIVKDVASFGNTQFVFEEAHLFKTGSLSPFAEFDKLLRMRTGAHNNPPGVKGPGNSVCWISQASQDMPRPILMNTQVLMLFKIWPKHQKDLENMGMIPDGLEFREMGTKPDGHPYYNHHLIRR
jgi:hypothetical protein